MGEDTTGQRGHSSRRHVSVDEAARELGLSVDAVRKRVQRGTIEHEKDAAGRVHILLDKPGPKPDNASTVRDDRPDTVGQSGALIDAKDETISELRERVKRLEHELDIRNEEVRRRDHLLAAALERIPPQLESPQEPQNESESAGSWSEEGTSPEESEKATGRSWWRRIFGG